MHVLHHLQLHTPGEKCVVQCSKCSIPRSDVSISATLPAEPIVFHGRDELVSDMVRLLVAHATARLAVLGAGGMGKTTVALALLHNPQVIDFYGGERLFLSCEALVDADAIIVSLAKLLGLPISGDLMTAVVSWFTRCIRVVLVLDNLETVWLVGGAPAPAVDELLGRFAQISTLSLIITCRSTDLPQLVEWSNTESAVLKAFSLEAAVQTFQDRAGRKIKAEEKGIAEQLLNEVDRMPLAVSLLGQLARRGNSVSELLDRWNRKRTSLLRTYGIGRFNNVGMSVELSIGMVGSADGTRESLRLLSLCSMLPDGMHQDVFRRLRPQFEDIDLARDNLCAYSLASLDVDGVLKTLSPVRHHVLERHPAQAEHREALCSIYFDIAQHLPIEMNEHYKKRAAVAALEMNNLSSLLLTMVNRPSEQIVDAVDRFTWFAHWQRPTLTVVFALLPHLEPHAKWKAKCLKVIGNTQIKLSRHRLAIESLTTAAQLFLEFGDRSQAAWCMRRAGSSKIALGMYDQGEALSNEAREVYVELKDQLQEAECRRTLGDLMRVRSDFPAAIEHLSAARQTFDLLRRKYEASRCSESLGIVYLDQGNLDSAAAELESALSAFLGLGDKHHTTQSTRLLGAVRCRQGMFLLAEQLLGEAETAYRESGDRQGLAACAFEFGYLRSNQGRREEAIACFKSAHCHYEDLEVKKAKVCRVWIDDLQSTVHVQ